MSTMVEPRVSAGHTALEYQGLVSDTTWERVVTRIMKVHSMDRGWAERVFDQTLGYLRLCSRRSELGEGRWLLGPSPEVDKGVHVFYLYTPELFELFDQINGGVFIHHVPNDKLGARTEGRVQTVTAFRRLGMPFDQELWASLAHGCANEDGEGPPDCFDTTGG